MTFFVTESLAIGSDQGFEVGLRESGVATYQDAACSAAMDVDVSDSLVRIHTRSVRFVAGAESERTRQDLVASRVIAALLALDLPLFLHAPITALRQSDEVGFGVDAPELLSLMVVRSPPTLLQFLGLLDAISRTGTAAVSTSNIALSIEGTSATFVCSGARSTPDSDAHFTLTRGSALGALYNAIVSARRDGAQRGLHWPGGEVFDAGTGLSPASLRKAVGEPCAVVQLVTADSSEVTLAVGAEVSVLSARNLSSRWDELIANDSALVALMEITWGSEVQAVGPCEVRITTPNGIRTMDEVSEEPEAVLQWIANEMEQLGEEYDRESQESRG